MTPFNGDEGCVYCKIQQGVINKTDKAILFDLAQGRVWVPKSVVVDYNKEIVCIQGWFAKDHKLKSDW